jgi:hypothetical protein
MRCENSRLTALAISALSLSTHSSEAQGYAPWPPPPGMTAGEYAARYGHRITPDEYAGRPQYHGGFERGYERLTSRADEVEKVVLSSCRDQLTK